MEESLAPVENSGEDVLSMIDVLKEENELEEEANAVLGDSDDQNCTYPMVKNNFVLMHSCLQIMTSSSSIMRYVDSKFMSLLLCSISYNVCVGLDWFGSQWIFVILCLFCQSVSYVFLFTLKFEEKNRLEMLKQTVNYQIYTENKLITCYHVFRAYNW